MKLRSVLLFSVVISLTLLAVADEKVERLYKHHSEQILILDFSNYPGDLEVPWEIEWQSGQATHMGLFTSSGTGTVDLDTGESTGSGYATAANGDKLYWELTGSPSPLRAARAGLRTPAGRLLKHILRSPGNRTLSTLGCIGLGPAFRAVAQSLTEPPPISGGSASRQQ